jgi:tryptophan 2,3-dioxygenase
MPSHDDPSGPAGVDGPSFYGPAALDYSDYLQIDPLTSLQTPQSDPPHHDEMLFIVIHQAYELWFKLIIHELETAIGLLARRRLIEARHFLVRVVEVFQLLTRQIHMLETMRPVDFLGFRDRLKPASGFQSLQFREIEFLLGLKDESYLRWFDPRPEQRRRLQARLEGPDVRQAFYQTLREEGFPVPEGAETSSDPKAVTAAADALQPLYQKPVDDAPVYLLAETLVDLDEAFSLWRQHHVLVVERIIGFKRGTGGSSGAAYLRSTTSKRCFPILWEVRTRLKE